LRGKGLDSVAIENGLKELDEEKYKKALLKTMKEKARRVNKKTKFEKMGPIIRFAQSRGYEPELIHRYINEVVK
ncbi:MAG TPA: RecX family transcriptional regulator, partial [Prolixibacteraceae bacterium]|nr:RecX family transcriptional regulator [Prolixibacteraceae bacterium]